MPDQKKLVGDIVDLALHVEGRTGSRKIVEAIRVEHFACLARPRASWPWKPTGRSSASKSSTRFRSPRRRASACSAGGWRRQGDVRREPVFQPSAFAELRNAQMIVAAPDSRDRCRRPICYLKPGYLPGERSHYQALAEGKP